MTPVPDYRWGVLGHSQRGASHVRQGLPNQDAIRWHVLPDGSPPAIVAVADGHGSARSFRSDVGAALGVETAVKICQDFVEGIGQEAPSTVKQAAEQKVPLRILQSWKQQVEDHLQRYPFTQTELDNLEQQAGLPVRERVASGQQPLLAYGSTLLIALLTHKYLICFQLGDGEILAVSDVTGEIGWVVAKDELLIANETTSLSQDNALRHVRCRFQLLEGRPPGLVLLASDGYPNSFASRDDFRKAGEDYLNLLRTDGPEAVAQNLAVWLQEASRDGSGDDITLGIIYRREPPLAKAALPPTIGSETATETEAADAHGNGSGEHQADRTKADDRPVAPAPTLLESSEQSAAEDKQPGRTPRAEENAAGRERAIPVTQTTMSTSGEMIKPISIQAESEVGHQKHPEDNVGGKKLGRFQRFVTSLFGRRND